MAVRAEAWWAETLVVESAYRVLSVLRVVMRELPSLCITHTHTHTYSFVGCNKNAGVKERES